MYKANLKEFLEKYPNQWHSYSKDYQTRKAVNNLLKKNIKGKYPFLIIANHKNSLNNQMFYCFKKDNSNEKI